MRHVSEALEPRVLLSATLVKDLNNSSTFGSFPGGYVPFKNEIYFTASTSRTGREIFKSDGNSVSLLKDTSNNPYGYGPFDLTVAGSNLFFHDFVNFDGGGLWRSDGTTAGTLRLLPGVDVQGIATIGSNAYIFIANSDGSGSLWKSDGTAKGTNVVKNDILLQPNYGIGLRLKTIGNTLYFIGASNADGKGFELYKTDGTAAGTKLVSDINPGPGSSNPLDFTAVGSQIFFHAETAAQEQALYVTDGTTATLVKVLYSQSGYSWELAALNNKLLFTTVDESNSHALWSSDGTSGGTQIVASNLYPSSFTTVGNTLYFIAVNETTPNLLYKTNGTTSGTVPVTSKLKYVYSLGNFNGTLFFGAVNSKGTADAFYKTGGTDQTTTLIRDINPTGTDEIFGYGILGNKLWDPLESTCRHASLSIL